ncbi:RDD family protein [Clostridiaceae bacterium M8S5]|nr:RDD family protein [Clostridiaceae bacterium M8S5]
MGKNELLSKQIKDLKNRELFEVINAKRDEYVEEAVDIAKEELKKRNLPLYIESDNYINSKEKHSEHMMFMELFLQVSFEDVFKELCKIDYSFKQLQKQYEIVFDSLISTFALNDEKIYISLKVKDNLFDSKIKEWEICGIDIDTKEEYSVELLEWEYWMSSIINIKEVDVIGRNLFVAHCLKTMTKYGLSAEEINNEYNNLKDTLNCEEVLVENEIEEAETKSEHKPWLRFWARCADYIIVSSIYIIITRILGIRNIFVDIKHINFMPITRLVYVIIEIIILSTLGTTPAKYICNIKINTGNEKKISFKNACIRSTLVYVVGCGMYIAFIDLITGGLAYNKLEETNSTYWDNKAKTTITYGKMSNVRIIIMLIITAIPLVLLYTK